MTILTHVDVRGGACGLGQVDEDVELGGAEGFDAPGDADARGRGRGQRGNRRGLWLEEIATGPDEGLEVGIGTVGQPLAEGH